MDGVKLVFHAHFAPIFPHVKSIYAAILEAKNCQGQCLINKLNQRDWEQVGETTWRLAVIVNKVKYVLVINERGFFHATAPMWLASYE